MRTRTPPQVSILGALRSVWSDRARVLGALVSASLLWFLLGQRVEDSTDAIRCDIRPHGPNEAAGSAGLWLRIPESLVFVRAEPDGLELTLVGMREDVSEIGGQIRGHFDVPEEFCGTLSEKSAEIDVTRTFTFPQIKAHPSLKFKESKTFTLTVARREKVPVTLSRDNIDGIEGVAGDVIVAFDRSQVEVSGPRSLIERIRIDPSLLKLNVLGERTPDEALAKPLQETVRSSYLSDGGIREGEGLLTIEGGRGLVVSMEKGREFRNVTFSNVEVLPVVPMRSRRENVDWEEPFKFTPATVDVNLRVPEEYFARGKQEADLRRELAICVNLGVSDPNLGSGRLPVHAVGLPESVAATFSPNQIDYEWKFRDSNE